MKANHLYISAVLLCTFLSLPFSCLAQEVWTYSYVPFSKHELIRTNMSGLSFKIFLDINCSSFIMTEGRIMDAQAKMPIANSDCSLCVVSEYGPECWTTELAIITPDGKIRDQITGAVYGTNIIVKQFRISKDGLIHIYTFRPSLSGQILIESCSLFPNRKIEGKIIHETYKIESERFVQEKCFRNRNIIMSCEEVMGDRSNLWDL